MSRTNESRRRKDNCVTCENFKPIKAHQMCQNCWHKVKRKTQPKFFLSTRHTEIIQRCTNPNNPLNETKIYLGLPVCDKKSFVDKFLNNENFNKLFVEWQQSNYEYRLCPSVDRIDKNKGYVLDNLQFITHSENCSKDNESKIPVDVYTLNEEFVGSWECLDKAVKALDVQQSNAWKVLYGKRRHTEGYVFKRTKA